MSEALPRQKIGKLGYSKDGGHRRPANLIRLDLRWNRPAHYLRIFRGEERAVWKFLGQFMQELLRQGILFLAPCCQRQKNFRKWLEIPAFVSRFSDQFHAELFIAMNTAKPQNHSSAARKATDDVIRRARRDPSVICIGPLR